MGGRSGRRKGIVSSPITKTLRKGICPFCGLPLTLNTEEFKTEGLSVALRENRTSLNVSCSGEIALWSCAQNHFFPSEIHWRQVSIFCGNCGSSAYPDRNAIICSRCGILTSSRIIDSLAETIILWVIESVGFPPNHEFSEELAKSSQERMKFLSSIFATSASSGPVDSRPASHTFVPPPPPPPPPAERKPLPKMKQPFSTPRREGSNREYEVFGLLAHGGFSHVFLARQSNGSLVVIKKPWGYRTEQEEGRHGRINPYGIAVEKLNIEASFLKAAVGNRGVVDFLDLYDEGGYPCLVMRFVDGPSLREHVASRRGSKQSGGLDQEEALRIFEQVLDIIRFVHTVADKVHRDITPNNVIMEDGRAVMIDFGTISDDKGVSEEVHTGIQAGGYHAPEQTQGASAKVCDIYSLGSTMYFLLTGRDPPQPSVRNPTDRVMAHELQKVGVPEELIYIIMKARAFSPGARFLTIDDLRNAILTFKDPSRIRCMVCDSPMHVAAVTCRSCGATRCDICGDFSQKDQASCSCGATFCSACRVANLAEAVYCRFCGQSLRDGVACPSCGKQTPISAIFCKFCGSRVAPAA